MTKEKTKNLIILRGANAQTHANRIELSKTMLHSAAVCTVVRFVHSQSNVLKWSKEHYRVSMGTTKENARKQPRIENELFKLFNNNWCYMGMCVFQ